MRVQRTRQLGEGGYDYGAACAGRSGRGHPGAETPEAGLKGARPQQPGTLGCPQRKRECRAATNRIHRRRSGNPGCRSRRTLGVGAESPDGTGRGQPCAGRQDRHPDGDREPDPDADPARIRLACARTLPRAATQSRGESDCIRSRARIRARARADPQLQRFEVHCTTASPQHHRRTRERTRARRLLPQPRRGDAVCRRHVRVLLGQCLGRPGAPGDQRTGSRTRAGAGARTTARAGGSPGQPLTWAASPGTCTATASRSYAAQTAGFAGTTTASRGCTPGLRIHAGLRRRSGPSTARRPRHRPPAPQAG